MSHHATLRAHGWHLWKDRKRDQLFWCRCPRGHDHSTEPTYPEK